MNDLIKKAKKLFLSYRKKCNPFPGPNFHYKYMLEYGRLRYTHEKNFDLETYEIAVWLHDIGRFTKEDKTGSNEKERAYHKKVGVKIFDKKFAHLIKDIKQRKIVRRCILEHSGKISLLKRIGKRQEEIQVIREADRISFLHPAYIEWLVKHDLKDLAKRLLKDNYSELKKIGASKFAMEIARKWKRESERKF